MPVTRTPPPEPRQAHLESNSLSAPQTHTLQLDKMKRSLPTSKTTVFWLGWLIVLALIPRVLFVTETFNKIEFNALLNGTDQNTFHTSALRYKDTSYWQNSAPESQAPLYPYFLSRLYKYFGEDVRTIRVTQALIGLGSCILIFLIASQFFSPLTCFLCALIYALYDYALYFESVLLRATLISFLHLLALFLLLQYFKTRRAAYVIGAGLFIGINIFTRPNSLMMASMGLITIMLVDKTFYKKLVHTLVFGLAIFLVLSPQIIKNAQQNKPLFLFSSQGGNVLAAGNMPDSPGYGWYVSPMAHDLLKQTKGNTGQVLKGILTIALDHPKEFLRVQGRKLKAFFNAYEVPNNVNFYLAKEHSRVLTWLPVNFHILVILCIPGLWLGIIGLKESKTRILLYGYALMLFSTILPFYILGRFRLPFTGVMCVLSGFALQALFTWIQHKNFVRPLLLIVAVAGLAYSTKPMVQSKILPNDYYNFGHLFNIHKEYSRAEDSYIKSLQIAPQYQQSAIALLKLYLDTRQHEKALDHITQQLEQRPTDIQWMLFLAKCRILLGQYEEAENVLINITSAYPDVSETYYELGMLQWHQQDYQKSHQYFRRLYQLDPSNASAKKMMDQAEKMIP